MENKVDGNAAAGILQTLFPCDMTMVPATCMGCNTTNVIGTIPVYMHGMGMVFRCPICDTMLMRIAHIKEYYWLDMHGLRSLRIPFTG